MLEHSKLYGPKLIAFQEYLTNLNLKITEDDILEWLKMYRRFPFKSHLGQPSIEMINNLGGKELSIMMDSDGYLDFNLFKKYYDLGFAFIISDILDYNKQTREIEKTAYEMVGARIAGNFYFSHGGGEQAPSLKLHTDAYDIFVKTVYGISHWVIGDQKIKSTDQQVHYVPPEVLHGVYSVPEPRLSLVLGCYSTSNIPK